jgi:hypothetical protein
MLTYSQASNAARRINFDETYARAFNDSRPGPGVKLLRFDSRSENGGQPSNGRARPLPESNIGHVNGHALAISPADVVSRRASAWDGIKVEVVQSVTHDKVEFRFRAPCHLLLVYEEGVRDEGETAVGDLPPSPLRTLRRKLTFVPAGHDYREWQRPRVRSRVICFYFDPAKLPIHSDASPTAASFAPRLFFENNVLWDTAVKLAIAMEDGCESERYCEALGVVVAHELLRMHVILRRRRPAGAGQPCRLAAAYRRRLHRRAPRRADTTQRAGEACSLESLLFLPRVQTVVRHSAAPLPHQTPHRTRQGTVGRPSVIRDRRRARARL